MYTIIKKEAISLVITTYNRPDALALVLKSVKKQSLMPIEVIIADDGSTQETRHLIKSCQEDFPVKLKHCWHEDLGFRLSHIRNKAFAMATGDYIIMVDGDVILHQHFIRDHHLNISPNRFIQGSRVLLSRELTHMAINNNTIQFPMFSKGIVNRLSSISISFFSVILSRIYSRKQTYHGVRGCNMSFWKSDLVKVNGFSEEFVGWGREDSEFAVRMLNNGIQRYNLKLGGVAYHLWHEENKNLNCLQKNDAILAKAIMENRKFCNEGLNRHMSLIQ